MDTILSFAQTQQVLAGAKHLNIKIDEWIQILKNKNQQQKLCIDISEALEIING